MIPVDDPTAPKLSDARTAAIRTIVKAVVGFVIAKVALKPMLDRFGIDEQVVVDAMFPVAVGLYSLAVSWLEHNVSPWFGVLAGVPKHPTYPAPAPDAPATDI